MRTTRVALANVLIPANREASVNAAVSAIAEAGRQGALILCFPECFIPGYRWPGAVMPAPDAGFLEQAVRTGAAAAKAAGVAAPGTGSLRHRTHHRTLLQMIAWAIRSNSEHTYGPHHLQQNRIRA